MKNLLVVLFAYMFMVVSGCTTSRTYITGTWTNPEFSEDKGYDNILVAALTDNVRAKTTVESVLAAQLRNEGMIVSKSMNVFPPNFSEKDNDKEKMLDKIKKKEANAILTVTLIDEDTETRYIPNAPAYRPYPMFDYYGRFWGYYSYWYPQLYTPGYYTRDKVYFIETNLYDAETEKLIWSAQSETYNPVELETFSEDFARKVVSELEEDNIVG